MCKLGAILPDLAEAFGVAVSTIELWMVQHKEFSVAIKKGRKPANDKVELSLYNQCFPFSLPAVHFSSHEGKVTTTPYIKWYPPIVQAQQTWLNNRCPDRWSRAPEIGDEGTAIPAIIQFKTFNPSKNADTGTEKD